MERYTHSVYQTLLSPTGLQDFCPGPAKGIGNWAGTDPSPLRARNVANEVYPSPEHCPDIGAAVCGRCGLSHSNCYTPPFSPQW